MTWKPSTLRAVLYDVTLGIHLMLSALLRLFALRPLLTLTLFGIPILILVVVGLLTIWALKLFIFIVLPIGLIFWLVKRIKRSDNTA